MSNKLWQAVHQKYKRSSSKSNLKNHNSIGNIAKPQPEKELQLIFTNPKVTELVETFSKQIQSPIQLYTQLYQSKAPQKCLQHNNISTLYCLNDQRLLCAGCMYQTSIHKGHKVLPLNKANDIMKNDIKNTASKIEEHLIISKQVIQNTVKNLDKAEKEYPELMEQVHNFFMDLHQLLIDRKNEHLKLLNQIWTKLRYENYTMKGELTRIHDYIRGKLQSVALRTVEEDITFNKNIIDHLARIDDIIDKDMVEIQENPYFKEVKKFKNVAQYVKGNLILAEIKSKTIQSLYLADYKLKKSNSKSSIKKTSYNTPKNARTPKKENFGDKQKTAEERLLDMHYTVDQQVQKRKSPKNRHSINEVKLIAELNDKKKVFQKEKLKKLTLTPSKSHKSIKKSIVSSPKSIKKQKLNKTQRN